MSFFESLYEKTFVLFFLGGLVSLVTITNPLSKIPLFLALTRDMDEERRRHQARKACIYAFAILTVRATRRMK